MQKNQLMLKKHIIFLCSFFLSIPYMVKGQSQNEAVCDPSLLEESMDPFIDSIDSMLRDVESILTQVKRTPSNTDMLEKVKIIIEKWKTARSFQVEDFLQIAHFLGVKPSRLLRGSIDLESLEGLHSRSPLTERAVEFLLQVINRHLKSELEIFQRELALDSGEPDFGLSDLAKMMGISDQELLNIKSSDEVPDYLQLAQVLDVGSPMEIFFEEVEADAEFRLNLMFAQVENIINKVEKTPRNQYAIRMIRDDIRKWRNGRKNFHMQTLLQIAYFFGVNPSLLLSSTNLESHIRLEDLGSRSYLPDSNTWQLLRLILSHLTQEINEYQSRLNLENTGLTERGEVRYSENRLRMSVPKYLQFNQLLDPIGTNFIAFFRYLESSPRFRTHFYVQSEDNQSVDPHNKRMGSLEETQILQNVGLHIINCMNQRGITERKSIYNLIGSGVNELETGRHNFYISTVIKASYVTHYTLSEIINGQNSYIATEALPDIRSEKTPERQTFIDKTKKVLVYLIKSEMRGLNISLQELSKRSGILLPTIQRYLDTSRDIQYLNLLKIVEYGFGIPLGNFLGGQNSTGFSIEELIQQFDSINFNVPIEIRQKDEIIDAYLALITERLSTAIAILNVHFSKNQLKNLTGINNRDFQARSVSMRLLIVLAHVFNLTLLEFLTYEDLSLITSFNTERLSREDIQKALNILSENMQTELDGVDLSLSDLHIRSGVEKLSQLNPILNGQPSSLFYRLAQICRALLQPEEDIFAPLWRLLEGVSTLTPRA